MKHLFLLLAFLWCSQAWGTVTHVQVADHVSCATPCAVTVTSTGAHNLLVAGLTSSATTITITGVTAGACNVAWVHAPNTAVSGTGDGSADLYACTDSVAAITSISISASSCSSVCTGIIWESHSTLGSFALDAGATPSQNRTDASCTSCAGVGLTLSGNNDYIVAIAACGGVCSGLTGTGWTNDLANPNGDGYAHGITSGSQNAPATWTQTSGTLVCNAAAFQEAASAAIPPNLSIGGQAVLGGGAVFN